LQCENLGDCPFYNAIMDSSRGIGSIYKKKYCIGDQFLCARYQVYAALGAERVPASLYPNMNDIAAKIIEEAEKA